MQIVLVLPGLLALSDTDVAAVSAPALAHLLAGAGAPERTGDDLAAALASHYGIERQADWPLAPIRLAALGADPGADYWLAADPVTLVAGRDDVRVAGVVDDLDRAEADALLATLNAHFADDGLRFVAPRPDALFVRAATPPALTTRPPAAASSRPLRTLLPEGADADRWRRWQSEIQMLLHEHAVNVAREREGKAPANSLWLSCGGTLPPRRAGASSMRTFADAGIAIALAAHAGSPALALPAGLGAALADAAGVERMVIALGSRTGVATLERAWAAPLRAALAAGRMDAVTLLADGAGDAVAWNLRRPGMWQRLAGRMRRHDLAALLAAARPGP
jgi:hypothetical protein